jgi:hypothetical protein
MSEQFPATIFIYYTRDGKDARWAFTFRDPKGDRVYGIADSRSAIVAAFPSAHCVDNGLPLQSFEYTTEGWGYAGCTCEQLQTYVKKGLSNG